MGHTNIYRDVLKAQFKSGGLGVFAINTPIAGIWREKNSAGFWIENAQGREGKTYATKSPNVHKRDGQIAVWAVPKKYNFYDGANGVRSEEVPYKTIPNHTKTNKNHTKTNQTKPNQPKPSKPLFDQLRQFHNSRDVFVEGSV